MSDAITVDDLASPRLPRWFRAAHTAVRPTVGRLGDLDEETLLGVARRRTGLDDFGDDHFREPFGVLARSLDREAGLSTVGRVMAHQLLVQLLSTRLRVHDLVARHPEITSIPIDRPLIVLGLPRTGTSHLLNLLATDPGLRTLPYWESLDPIGSGPDGRPPDDRPDPRLRRTAQALALMHRVMPLFPAMHEMTVEGPHEEIQLLAVDFATMLFEASYDVPSYAEWYRANDQTPSYHFLRLMLQVLTFLRGGERWALKSPQHLEQLGPLLAAFPDARIVQTHRDPVAVTASMCTMAAYTRRMQHAAIDPLEVGAYWAARVETMLRASVRDRDVVPPSQIIDVHFHEYMADQMATIERVYAVAEVPLTATARGAISTHLAANPRGKHGRLVYRLSDVGLDAGERRAALRFYQDRFDVPDELLPEERDAS